MPLVVRRELRTESEAAMQTETHIGAAARALSHRPLAKKTEGALGRSLRAAVAWTKTSLPQAILLVVWGAMLFVTYARVRADLTDIPRSLVTVSAVGMVLLCALPTILMFCLALLAQGSLNARLSFEVAGAPGDDESDDGFATHTAAARERAARIWRYESKQVQRARGRFVTHAGVYGFVSSMVLLCCLILVLRDLAKMDVEHATYRSLGAISVGTAVAVAFGADLARMLIRSASRDSSPRMLAWATKRLLVTITGTILFAALAFAGELDQIEVFKRGFGSILLGAAVAVLGDRITLALNQRAAATLGIALPERSERNALHQINGLEDEDALRLGEEGIDSVHALALCATPKLFFSTPYALPRICDWQDQALLIARVGASRAQLFRDQLMVSGAIDAARLARQMLSGALDEGQREEVNTVLGFGNKAQAKVAFESLATDVGIAVLRAYRAAMPALVVSDEQEPESTHG
jgi:hypothetical protein